MNAGINLFTLHKFIQTEDGLLATVLRLKELGYSYLQYSGAPFDGKMIARVSKEADMPFVLTHVPVERIIEDTDNLMEEHELFGCKNIGLGGVPNEIFADECTYKRKVDELNLAGERMAKAGFKFFYHNHYQEFMIHNGQTAYEYMIEIAPFINFTYDTYWAQYGGMDVVDLLKRLNGRVECVHLKDYKIAFDSETKVCSPIYAPVGSGTMNFRKIVEVAKSVGAKYFFVEQDNACLADDPWGEVTKSINYIKERL